MVSNPFLAQYSLHSKGPQAWVPKGKHTDSSEIMLMWWPTCYCDLGYTGRVKIKQLQHKAKVSTYTWAGPFCLKQLMSPPDSPPLIFPTTSASWFFEVEGVYATQFFLWRLWVFLLYVQEGYLAFVSSSKIRQKCRSHRRSRHYLKIYYRAAKPWLSQENGIDSLAEKGL